MARRRYGKKRKHGKAKPSVISMVPLVVLGARAMSGYQRGGAPMAAEYVVDSVTGYSIMNKDFNPFGAETIGFYGAIVGTYAAKKLIAMAGVNRAMKGLPFRL